TDLKEKVGQIANFIINRPYDKNLVINLETDKIDKVILNKTIKKVLKSNEKAIKDYTSGKENALFFLIGQVVKSLDKKIDMKILKTELIKLIKQ
ncbi:MAG: hypothetical protein WEC80_02265, partial [Patescibacteria group bacterium]